MKEFTEIALKINPLYSDIVCNIFEENFDCEGIITETAKYEKTEQVKLENDVVKAYVTDEIDESRLKKFFEDQKKRLIELKIFDEDPGSFEITVTKQENKDWSKKWKENWRPTHVSAKTVICPSWLNYEPTAGETVITVDPGNAFGTGTHATTALCVRAIEKYVKPGDEVADVGCGSGILAICAIKYGAKSADATDNDETVIETARENTQINGVSDEIAVKFGSSDVLPDEKYDFVAANILHNVLVEIMPDLKRITKPGGMLSLSGILKEKGALVRAAYEKCGLTLVETTEEGDWCSFAVRKEK